MNTLQKTKQLMFSYGMNTNLVQMALRCPSAVSLGAAVLPNYAFEFKGFATVEQSPGNIVHGVLWEIGSEDEVSLDRLESYPYYYDKTNVKVIHKNKLVTAMTYFMYPEEVLRMPSNSYYNLVADGYEDHNISLDQLNEAIDRVSHTYRLTDDSNSCIM